MGDIVLCDICQYNNQLFIFVCKSILKDLLPFIRFENINLKNFINKVEPLLQCLQCMTTEPGWDMKTVTDANGFLSSLTLSKIVCAFCVCREILAFTKPLSV